MKRIFILLFLTLFFTITFSQENIKNIGTGVRFTPLVNIPENTILNEEFSIELISGLQSHMVTWVSNDTIINTPNNLILKIDKPGEYILHIRNNPQPNYKIKIQ